MTGSTRRRVGSVLLVVLVLGIAAVGVVGIVTVARLFSSGPTVDPGAVATLPPLLDGAPALTQPSAPPAATVDPHGFDVSHPQCGSKLPSGGGYGIVGVTAGRSLQSNPCLSTQLTWAQTKKGRAVYVNSGYPGHGDPVAYGQKIVDDAVARERAAGKGGTAMWWLDVETVNTWDGTARENATVIDAMAARLQELGARVGIYSTPSMWETIAGSWEPGLPVWYATGPGLQSDAVTSCSSGFAGSKSAIVQWVATVGGVDRDENLICPAYVHRAAELLDLS